MDRRNRNDAWTRLRQQVGLLLALLVLAPLSAGAAIFSVNTTDDDADANAGDGFCSTGTLIVPVGGGLAWECTLRAAIEEANASAGFDEIRFTDNLPTVAGIVEIIPATQLPWIYDPVRIDGYSHPDYDGSSPTARPVINLLGSSVATASVAGLTLLPGADGSQIQGLAIAEWTGAGILISPFFSPAPGNIRIEGNHIGVWRGVFYRGNDGDGIHVVGSNGNTIGTNCTAFVGCPGRGNLIATNGRHGVFLDGTSSSNTVAGNFIGTDRYGNSTFVPFGGSTPNAEWGVFVGPDADDNVIGDYGGIFVPPSNSTGVASGNVISGNQSGGVRIEGEFNRVFANRIGTNDAGTGALANQGPGVVVFGDDTTIGNVGLGSNVISGNTSTGVVFETPSGFTPVRVRVQGNRIGVDATGSSPLGNGGSGISLWGNDHEILDNVIGGNAFVGISDSSYSNETLRNYIGTNASGADLGNTLSGISLSGGNVQIGTAGNGNVIGFNDRGITIGGSSYDITVQGNWIGTNASGADLGNVNEGIYASGAEYVIGGSGGTSNGLGNVIGHNGGVGIEARGFVPTIQGNWVGTNASGDDLGNSFEGIYAEPSSGGPPSSIGAYASDGDATVAAKGNVIAHNALEGLVLDGVQDVALRGNRMWNNGGIALDLGDNFETDNDPSDFDGGANNLQNFPEIDTVHTYWNDVSGALHVRYRVDALPAAGVQYPLSVDFYLHDPWLSPGDQARAFVASDTYVAAEAGNFKDVVLLPMPGSIAPNVHGFEFGGLRATATDADGNTSELSRENIPVPEPGMPLLLAAGGAGFALLGRRGRRA
ncbi:MAG: CSLREA domain-containing protein [bacterium]|nr:CSLREA domain-containing protein [bacterium]